MPGLRGQHRDAGRRCLDLERPGRRRRAACSTTARDEDAAWAVARLRPQSRGATPRAVAARPDPAGRAHLDPLPRRALHPAGVVAADVARAARRRAGRARRRALAVPLAARRARRGALPVSADECSDKVALVTGRAAASEPRRPSACARTAGGSRRPSARAASTSASRAPARPSSSGSTGSTPSSATPARPSRTGFLETAARGVATAILDLNLASVFELAQAAARRMVDGGRRLDRPGRVDDVLPGGFNIAAYAPRRAESHSSRRRSRTSSPAAASASTPSRPGYIETEMTATSRTGAGTRSTRGSRSAASAQPGGDRRRDRVPALRRRALRDRRRDPGRRRLPGALSGRGFSLTRSCRVEDTSG